MVAGLTAVKQDGSALAYASEQLQRDGEVVVATVKQDVPTSFTAATETTLFESASAPASGQDTWYSTNHHSSSGRILYTAPPTALSAPQHPLLMTGALNSSTTDPDTAWLDDTSEQTSSPRTAPQLLPSLAESLQEPMF